MADLIQIRRDTTAGWTAENPTLADGEFGLDKTLMLIKVGNGITPWNSLDYSISAENLDWGVIGGTITDQTDLVESFVDQDSNTGAANLPTGTTAQRPSTPTEGMFRRNSETGAFEGYTGSSWAGVGGASGGAGNPFVYEHDKTVTEDYTIGSTQNAISAGPLTIADGVSVTVADGATWVIVG